MTTDNKTLADVQPGGRVRLGDGLAVEKLARELLAKEWDGLHTEHMSWSDTESGEVEAAWIRSLIAALLRDQPVEPLDHKGGCGSVASARELLDLYADPIPVAVENGSWFMVREQDALDAIRAALSAQPSSGGQGVWPFVESPGEFTERLAAAMQEFDLLGAVRHVLIEKPPALAARQPVGEPAGYATFRDGRFGSWLFQTRAMAESHDSTAVAGGPANSEIVPLFRLPAQAVDLEELRRAVCVVGVVGQIDGHDVVRRNSVLDVIDTRRQRLADSQAVGNGN